MVVLLVLRGLVGNAMAYEAWPGSAPQPMTSAQQQHHASAGNPAQHGHLADAGATTPAHSAGSGGERHSGTATAPADAAQNAAIPAHCTTLPAAAHATPDANAHGDADASCDAGHGPACTACDICYSSVLAAALPASAIVPPVATAPPQRDACFSSACAAQDIKPPIS